MYLAVSLDQIRVEKRRKGLVADLIMRLDIAFGYEAASNYKK